MILRSILASGLILCGSPIVAHAQTFEGVLRERMIMVPPEAVARLVGTTTDLDSLERVFSFSQDELLALPPTGVSGESLQVIERTLYTRGSKTRMEVRMPRGTPLPGVETTAIIDGESGSVTMILPMIRAYMVVTDMLLSTQLAALSQVYAGFESGIAPTVELIGNETIGGTATEGYEIRAGSDLVARGWTAPAYRGAINHGPLGTSDPTAILMDRGLPMRSQLLVRSRGPMTALYGEGYLYLTTEVLSIDREDVDERRFEIPDDYVQIEMGGRRTTAAQN